MNEVIKRIDTLAEYEGLSLTGLEKFIGASKGTLTRAAANGTDIQLKWIVEISKKFPVWSLEWIITGNGGMYSSVETVSTEIAKKVDLVPELPIDAAAGFTDDIQSGITPSMCNMLPRIPGLPPYDLTISVRGDSMDPTFASGDRLAIRRCVDIIEWGAPHVLDTSEGVYIKRIKEDKQNIICISDNSDYPQFNIPKTCIRGLYKVVALLRVC